MSRTSTTIVWLSALLLLAVFVAPLWVIGLQAPQYPQGLGIHIWVDRITGAAPHDLQNINGLNHYIGMKKIEPDAIPELRFMKYVVVFLVALGAATALSRRRSLLVVWVVLAIALAAVGMWDFYQWEYEYGHDLDPSAAIKVPGMSYQPPMFGTKQLLNFRTTAWPGAGGVAAMLSVALAVLALAIELWRSRRSVRRAPARASLQAAALAVVLALPVAQGCQGGGPRPIDYGVAQCDWCMMTVSDDRYGSEAISAKGRVYVFDSIECLVNAAMEGEDITFEGARGLYVTDFAARGTLVDARTAVYLHSEALPSPMGENLTAFASRETAEQVRAERGGEFLDWAGVRQQVARNTPTESQGGATQE